MKYSESFERDYNWYLSVSELFSFDGSKDYYNKKGKSIIVPDVNGVSAKEAFYLWDSSGQIVGCRESEQLRSLLKTKGSVNLHIKMYAQSMAEQTLSLLELRAFSIKIKAPSWFQEAVEKQRWRIVAENDEKKVTNLLIA